MLYGSFMFVGEVLLVVLLGKKLATMVARKGREPYNFVYLFAVLIFAGEFAGFLIVPFYLLRDQHLIVANFDLFPYLCGLVTATAGGSIGFLVAALAAPQERPPRQEIDEDEIEDDDDFPSNAETGIQDLSRNQGVVTPENHKRDEP